MSFELLFVGQAIQHVSMRRLAILILLACVSNSANAQAAQAAPASPQKLQEILDELRAIHRDLRANATTQLLLAELQLAQTSLDRATQRRDGLRSEVIQLQGDEKSAQAELVRVAEVAEKSSDATLKVQLADRVRELKDGLARITVKEQGEADQLQDAENRARTAKGELDSVQSQLGDLVKRLAPAN